MKCVTFGEVMLQLNPHGYERILQTTDYRARYCGAEINVAVDLACLGDETEFVTKLPLNDVAQNAINGARHFGVGVDRIVRGGDRIGIFFLEKGADRRPSKVIYDRAHSAIAESRREDYNWNSIFEGADWFHFSGITPALGGELLEICLDACKKAKELGLTISFDPNYRAKLWTVEEATAAIKQLMPYVDLLIVNENQAAQFFGIQIPEGERDGDDITDAGYLYLAKTISEQYGVPMVALTERRTFSVDENSLCAKLYDGKELFSSDKYRMRMIDRVGSGDSFAAGLLYALRHGYSHADAIRFAAAASCLNHSIEGDYNILSVDEVLALAKGNTSGRVQR